MVLFTLRGNGVRWGCVAIWATCYILGVEKDTKKGEESALLLCLLEATRQTNEYSETSRSGKGVFFFFPIATDRGNVSQPFVAAILTALVTHRSLSTITNDPCLLPREKAGTYIHTYVEPYLPRAPPRRCRRPGPAHRISASRVYLPTSPNACRSPPPFQKQ